MWALRRSPLGLAPAMVNCARGRSARLLWSSASRRAEQGFGLAQAAKCSVLGSGFAAGVGAVSLAKKIECESRDVRKGDEEEKLVLVKKRSTKAAVEAEELEKEKEARKKAEKEKWWLLLTLMAQEKWYFLLAAVSSTMSSLAMSSQGKVIGQLFDLMGSGSFEQLLNPLKNLLGLFVSQAMLSFVSSFALAVATTELGRRLRVAFYESTLKQDISKFDEAKTGELTHQLSQDIGALQTAVRSAFSRGVEGVTSIISGSIYLYMASPKLALCMFAVLPVMSGAAHLLGVLLRGISEKIRKASARSTGIANETFGAIHTVRVFNAEERELERFSKELEYVSSLKKTMALTAGGFYSTLYLGINLITLLICGYGGLLVSQGELTRGGIAAVVTQVQILERSMARLSITSAQLSKAFRSSEHVFDAIMDEPVVNTSKGGKNIYLHPNIDVHGDVTFNNVSFAYPSRKQVTVLKDFDLDISSGKVVALVGQSGSGKSTCANLLTRHYDVTNGSITIDGVDLRDLDPKSLHEIVGVVSQEPVLFGTTILENIRYGKPDATMEEVIEAARSANAHNFINDFPKGYETELGERGVLLSGGQRQRIAIARIILRDPKVLILDESTSALDNESERIVQEALDKLMTIKRRTTIIIAHRLTTIQNADLICVLSKGKMVESGTFENLLAKKDGIFSRLYNMQKEQNQH